MESDYENGNGIIAMDQQRGRTMSEGMSATEAYEKAGYKRNDGSEVTKDKAKQQVRS